MTVNANKPRPTLVPSSSVNGSKSDSLEFSASDEMVEKEASDTAEEEEVVLTLRMSSFSSLTSSWLFMGDVDVNGISGMLVVG